MMVYRWVQLQKDEPTLTAQKTQSQTYRMHPSMAPRHLAWLFLHDAEQLNKQEKQTLALIRQVPNVELAYTLAHQLVTMIKERNALPLEIWLRDCHSSGISDLMTFAQGLEKEGSAFPAALTLPYSNDHVA